MLLQQPLMSTASSLLLLRGHSFLRTAEQLLSVVPCSSSSGSFPGPLLRGGSCWASDTTLSPTPFRHLHSSTPALSKPFPKEVSEGMQQRVGAELAHAARSVRTGPRHKRCCSINKCYRLMNIIKLITKRTPVACRYLNTWNPSTMSSLMTCALRPHSSGVPFTFQNLAFES